jgi:hypothetical protein
MKNNCKNEKTELEPARSTAFEKFLESFGNKEEAKLIVKNFCQEIVNLVTERSNQIKQKLPVISE